MAFLRFMLRRTGQHWQILLTLSLGVILATAVLVSGPLLVDTVVEMGLHLTFQGLGVADGNLRLTADSTPDRAEFQALDGEIQALLRDALGEHVDHVAWSAESRWLFPWVDGALLTDQRVNLRAYDGLQDRIEYVAGGWPAEPSPEPGVIRAVIGEAMTRAWVLRVGDRVPLSLEPDGAEPDAWIEVAGIVRPRNPLDPYWYGEFGPLTSRNTERWTAQYSLILPVDAFFPAVASLFPQDPVELAWHALLRHNDLFIADMEPLQAGIAGLEASLDAFEPRVTLQTRVPEILDRFSRQLESIRVPLYILVAEVMLLVLYFVTMIAALSMRQAEREFAILRSRGTPGWKIARIPLVEALVILAVAFVSGPWMGAGLVRALSWVGPLADLEQAEWALSLGQTTSQAAWLTPWLVAGVGALACLASILLPLRPALRRSIVTHLQMAARSTRPPWWQRLYLDVFFLVGGLVLLWRLRLYGGITTGGPGGVRLDWLLLLAPVALLVGSATVLLRVFPVILRGLANLAARGPGLEAPLALWQASRNPTHVTRLVLLLTLAIALGNLSLGLNITLDQSEQDRATYLAGKGLRLVSQRAVPLVDLQSAPGVLQLSGVWRGGATVDLGDTQADPRFEILAIEPNSFAGVAPFRDDYADQDVDELLEHLAVPEGEHPALLPLPGQPARFGLWLWGAYDDKTEMDSYHRWIDDDNDAERVTVVAKLQTAQGELFTVDLPRQAVTEGGIPQTERFTLQASIGGRDVQLALRIKPNNQGWYYFEGPLPALPASSYPLDLHSLWFQNQATRLGEPIGKQVNLVVDDLTVVDAETGRGQIVENFEGPARPLFLNTMLGDSRYVGLFTEITNWVSRSGRWGQFVNMGFIDPQQAYPLRLRQTWTKEPLPALASPTFLATTGLEVGDLVRAWIEDRDQAGDPSQFGRVEIDLRIAGAVDYFPTMYEELEAGYLITSRDLVLALLNDMSQRSTNPNEVLIEADGRTSMNSLSSLVPLLSQSWDADSIRKTLKANPLALGLRGVTFFGFVLTILLSLVGFATHFYLSIRQQEVLYGVMRALGASPRQLYGWIVIEQVVLILAGLVLGTGLGMLLNQVTLSRLPVSLGDQQPIPPFVPRADWLAVGWLYLFLALAFLAILTFVTALLYRARIHRILRIGQE